MDETYHSSKGALTESKHVFIREGMQYYLEHANPTQELKVLEIGFGTGLNALLAWEFSQKLQQSIVFETLEPFPLAPSVTRHLSYPQLLEESEGVAEIFEHLHSCAWNEKARIAPHFTLLKQQVRLEDYEASHGIFDVIFFDAFAPQKQGEMWEVNMLEKCFHFLKPQGVLTTYCAQGQFKRNLRSIGFEVFRVDGPPNGKREMTRAIRKWPSLH